MKIFVDTLKNYQKSNQDTKEMMRWCAHFACKTIVAIVYPKLTDVLLEMFAAEVIWVEEKVPLFRQFF